MLRSFGRPQAKAIVVLGYYNNAFKAARFCRAYNLHGVKFGGINYLRVFIAIAPFLISISIRPEMDKAIHLRFLPI